jgi:hypothetical protein
MLILDKSRALDLMVAQASRVPIPAEFSVTGEAAVPSGGGFRVAIYGPIEPATLPHAEPGSWQVAPASPRLGGQGRRSLAPSA